MPESDVQLHWADILHEYGKLNSMTTDDGAVVFFIYG